MIRWFGRLLVGLLHIAMFSIFVFLIFQYWIVLQYMGLNGIILIFGYTAIIIWPLLIAHEFGHVVAGSAMRIPFVAVALGPLHIVREGSRLRASWFPSERRFLAMFRHGPTWTTPAHVVMVLGGPILSLLVGGACIAVAIGLGFEQASDRHRPLDIGLQSLLLILRYPPSATVVLLNTAGAVSLLNGFGTLIPATTRGMLTDGGQLRGLWRYRKIAQTAGVPVRAVTFVGLAIGELSCTRRQANGGAVSHVTAAEFCEFLLTCRGADTHSMLRDNRLSCSEDVGRVVFGLVNEGCIARQESDSEEDFQGLFALDRV